jgi:hypothetical protein
VFVPKRNGGPGDAPKNRRKSFRPSRGIRFADFETTSTNLLVDVCEQ